MLAAACTRDLDLPAPLAPTGFLSGRAVSEIAGTDQTQAVANAQASIAGTNLHGVSDATGAFTLGPLPPGAYRVLLLVPGTSSSEPRQRQIDGITVTRGATAALGDVSLRRNAQVSGRALLDGTPTGNAGITVFVPGTNLVTVTGDSGQYTLRGIPEGTVRISTYRQGFTPASTADMAVQGGILTTAVDLVLPVSNATPQPGAIVGHVAVVGGDPLGATVAVYSPGNSQAVRTTQAAADGRFALDQLAPGIYQLRASLGTYPPVDVPNLLVTSATSIDLPDALVLSPLGVDNTPFDAGTPGGPIFAPDAGPSTDGGTGADGGSDGGHTVQCTTDNECTGGNLCVDNFCVPCAHDSDCRSGFICRQTACVRQCQANADCGSGEVCSAGTCGPCVTSSDCHDPAQVCLSGGVCGACRGASDCPAGKACLPGGCGACTKDPDCGAGNLCENGICGPGTCHDNTGCLPTQSCKLHECAACTLDKDCSVGRLCLGNTCTLANCRGKTDCTTAQACTNNLCGACATSTDCGAPASGLVCDPSGHTCVPGDCTSASDCGSAGMVCLGHSCSTCTDDTQCAQGQLCGPNKLCITGVCHDNTKCAATQPASATSAPPARSTTSARRAGSA